LVGESEMTVEDETKVPSWISGIEWAVCDHTWTQKAPMHKRPL